MHAAVSIREAVNDPLLLGNALAGESWGVWRSVLMAAMGETLMPEELPVFQEVTGGRTTPPQSRVDEALFLVGRRGGKDRAASLLVTYLACLVDWSKVLSRGERGIISGLQYSASLILPAGLQTQ
jgi:hypothetical protein